MAYRYFDGQGNEVLLIDAQALVHRIQLGDIAASTLIFDEDRDEWIRAMEHPAYLELVEGASGDGTRPTEIAVGAPSTNSASLGRFDVDSSASPKSVRATRSSFADPASVASRFATSRPDSPNIRRVARRWAARKRAVWGVAAAVFAPFATLFLVVFISGGATRATVFSSVSREPGTDGAAEDVWMGQPPAGAVSGLTASGKRYAARIAELRGEIGLHSSPPAIWLAGAYLAQPGLYPDVLEYWDGFRALVQTVRREDMLLYRSGLEAYLREGDLGDPERAEAWIWAVTAYDRQREPRRAVFDEFEELSAAATDLHVLLLRLGESVQYEPVEGGLLSRNPVLEIVIEDEEVADALGHAIDRVLESLASVHGLEPVSTDRLTRGLLNRLWATTVPVVPGPVV